MQAVLVLPLVVLVEVGAGYLDSATGFQTTFMGSLSQQLGRHLFFDLSLLCLPKTGKVDFAQGISQWCVKTRM